MSRAFLVRVYNSRRSATFAVDAPCASAAITYALGSFAPPDNAKVTAECEPITGIIRHD